MISYGTCGPHRPPNPWVVPPTPMEVDQDSEHPSPPLVEEISSSAIPLVPPNTGQKTPSPYGISPRSFSHMVPHLAYSMWLP